MRHYIALLHKEVDSDYGVSFPDLPGCVAAGSTLEEAAELIRGAVEMHLETMREDGDTIPVPTTVADCVTIPA